MKEKSNEKSAQKISEKELEILKFWQENKIFEKSLAKPSPKGEFVFYDGPPFANGLPHYGHILAGTIKDVIPRYKTMRGYNVPRRWGWDCHGLPVENLVEKELKLPSKKDIETYGIAKFNAVARDSVMRFANEWREIIPRLGRWVDMENDYQTMDSEYTESVWWAFKKLHDKKLIYEGFKSIHLCPRCETTLSNFEVSQGYKTVKDLAVTVKLKVKSEKLKNKDEAYTYLLAWTTTPWTLPGNVALAINKKVIYCKYEIRNPKSQIGRAQRAIAETKEKDNKPKNFKQGEIVILAKERAEKILKDYDCEIVKEFTGEKLIGLEYEPLFDYHANDSKLKNRENGWKIYGADFVTTNEGTGIVHIAPAFGEDDYRLSESKNLPFIQHLTTNGKFKKEVLDFADKDAKPKGDPSKTDREIIEFLYNKGLLFAQEKISHEYPHCWRCDTPLLNYATSSWFVKVTAIKNILVKENEKIHWVPESVGKYRFGNWLSEARDWAISRSRFWGAPIPVWRCAKCEKSEIVGSISDLSQLSPAKNKYLVMRHGEAENNVLGIVSSKTDNPHHLTELGRSQVERSAVKLHDKKMDLIISSPFIRTKETAEIVANTLGIETEKIIFDEHLREIEAPDWNGKPIQDYHACSITNPTRSDKNLPCGETHQSIKKRMGAFLYEVEKKWSGKTILIITHDSPAWLLFAVAEGIAEEELARLRGDGKFFIQNAEVRSLPFSPLPHNDKFELDLHRPYIDEVTLRCACGAKMKRVSEVFDCWFESGSMPFASMHYPFENLKKFNPKGSLWKSAVGFPANFIAEGLDQTRGWFYSMLVLSTGLFNQTPYKNVIVNGTILAENGEKMSKRLSNYPDPMMLVDKYGSDALRLYLLSSPAVHGEELRFSEQGVLELKRKVLDRLENVLTFYSLYAPQTILDQKYINEHPSSNVLDQWIVTRLNDVNINVTKNLEGYEISQAVRDIADLIDDLSTWYLRRSRTRVKTQSEKRETQNEETGGENNPIETLRFVLEKLSKLMAPFTPFFAEYLYQSVGGGKESVHLESWPVSNLQLSTDNLQLIQEMEKVRKIVSLGLEARAKANIKVRQPLSKLIVKGQLSKVNNQLVQLIVDEINVKKIIFDDEIQNEVELDTEITLVLKEEGEVRELVRAVQELRKQAGLTINDLAVLKVDTDASGRKLIEKNMKEILKSAKLEKIEFVSVSAEEIDVGGVKFKIKI